MTQVQLAEKLCYATERQLQRIENGDAICPVDRIVELAGILNTSTDYLLLGSEMNKSNTKDVYNTQVDGMYIVIVRKEESKY